MVGKLAPDSRFDGGREEPHQLARREEFLLQIVGASRSHYGTKGILPSVPMSRLDPLLEFPHIFCCGRLLLVRLWRTPEDQVERRGRIATEE